MLEWIVVCTVSPACAIGIFQKTWYAQCMKKKHQNGDTPATQHDLEILGGHLSSRIDDVEASISSLRYVVESILSVVQSIEGRFQETKGDHERVERHEERITAVEVQVRMLQK